jgi:methionyl aminopeptidase
VVSTARRIELKSAADLDKMRRAGRIAGEALAQVGKLVRPGVTTKDLDAEAERLIRKAGALPTFLGYRGYTASICASVNEEVVHGIPSPKKVLKEGDIISIDLGATYDGFVGDTAATFAVGQVSAEDRRLMSVTKESLARGIDQMRPGNRLGDVSNAIQRCAEDQNFGVVRDYVGHGIGRNMHEEPAVPNYGAAGTGMRLEVGLVLALEPMITAGSFQVKVMPDGWTVVTRDGRRAAHDEHTVAITADGPEILTARPGEE